MTEVDVLSVASEVYPLVKTGGLADVVGALPHALAAEGVNMRTLVPGYPDVLGAIRDAAEVHTFADLPGGPARLLAARSAGQDFLVLDAPQLYARPGNPYTGPDGADWPDNALRFAALAAAAASVARGGIAAFRPHVVHGHDWQAGLIPAYLRYVDGGAHVPTVMTVHNLAFQGQFPREQLESLRLPAAALSVDGIEYYGSIGFLKGGLALADRITTVSPTYASEIRTPEGGMGLDGLLRRRADVLSGIINGIDVDIWNPANDPHLRQPYDVKQVAARGANKVALQERLGLAVDARAFVFGVVSRLTWQKGLDLLPEVLPALDAAGAQLALLGTGDPLLEKAFVEAALARPGRMAAVIGYDEALAHMIQAGVDALLMPSRFEPCGLTQLCAMRYGAIPVVARVGGLVDTVVDANEMALAAGAGTGVQFAPVTGEQLEFAVQRVRMLARDRVQWRRVQHRAMTTDVGWTRPARRYAALYRELVARRRR